MFDIGNITLANMYLPSGNDAVTRGDREKYFSELIPKLIVNRIDSGCMGGDMKQLLTKVLSIVFSMSIYTGSM